MALHLRAPKARLMNKASVGEFFSEPRRNIFGSPVFGAPLDPASREVPPALVFLVSFIESKVLTTPGMLQAPAKWDEVLQYTGKMELGEITDHSEIHNPCVAMEILKIYLKDLPEPLLTYELYDPLMAINEAIADASDLEIPQHLGYLKDLLRTLPYINQLVVCYLVSFFAWLSSHSETTKTSHMNLGGLFGPYFLRPRHVSSSAGYSTADAVSLLSVLIARAGQILPNLDGYSESLALLNLQQSPLEGIAARPPRSKSKDPFASIRPGKRKTPATIRVKTFDVDDDEVMPASNTRVALVMAPPEYTIETLHKEPLKGPFNLIDAEMYEPLYQQNLAGKEQLVFVALDVEYGPLVLCQEKATASKMDSIRCILFHSYGTESISAPPNCKKISEMLKFIRVLYPSIPPQMKFSELNDPTMPNELRDYERKNMSKGAKFGVVFRRAGQTAEDDIFANNDVTHKGFNDFLAFLGDKIELTGFEGFRGGLDTKNKSTGTQSVYTKFGKTEIMFHIAPYLPWYPNDKQQLERKRHIGNDLAVIVFQEDETEFNPTWLTSEMNHVFVVVTACKDSWKIAIVSKKAVRTVAPNLPDPAIIPRNQLGRDFFLSKVLNVERAILHAPVFEKKLARTRRMLLENLIGESYNRRKAKMPKPSRPDSGARKSILTQLPQIASLQRGKRASTSDVSDQKALSVPEVAKPAISEPSLVSHTHAHAPEEGEDLLTMASSKHVKKALAKRVDALYRDTDVTMMMARDLADADEDEVAGLATAAPSTPGGHTADSPSGLSGVHAQVHVQVPLNRLQVEAGRQRALSDAPAPGRGHSRKPSNSPDPTTQMSMEAKRRASEIVTRLSGYVETCSRMQSMERTITLSKILKACHDIVDQNVQDYNPSLLPPAGKLTEAVGVSLPHLKESCKKAVGLFSDKFSGLLTVTLKVNNSADCVSLTKNIHVLETLLAAYDSSPDSLKDIPTDKLPRDPARELANAIIGAPMPALTRKQSNKDYKERPMSGSHEMSPVMPLTPSPHKENKERAQRLSGSHNHHADGKHSGKHDREASGAHDPPTSPHREKDGRDKGDRSHRLSGGKREEGVSIIVPSAPQTPSKRYPHVEDPPLPLATPVAKVAAAEPFKISARGSGTPSPLTRSMTDLRMVGQRLLQAMQRTQWKLVGLHRQLRDGQLTPSNAANILGQFTVQSESAITFLEVVAQFSALKRDVSETLTMGDMAPAQLRLVEATKATKAALDNWFAAHPFVAPADVVALAEKAMKSCSDGLSELSAAMLRTGISAVANRCTRLYRSIAKFLATQEELPIPPQVEANGALMTDAQHKALAELMDFLIAEAQSKLHALVHHIRNGSSSDPNRKWESLCQLEAMERVASLLSTEIQALIAPPTRPLPPPPAGGAAAQSLTISDEEMERLRGTLSYTAEVTENSIAMVESMTRQCQSLNLATALAALAVLLKKLRAGEPNLNLKALRVDSTADAGFLTPEQLTKLEHIRKLATTVFADTRVFMLTMSAEIASSNSTPDLLANAKLVASFKKALDDFVATNAEQCLM